MAPWLASSTGAVYGVWTITAVVCLGLAMRDGRRRDLAGRAVLTAAALLGVAVLTGAKLLAIVEHSLLGTSLEASALATEEFRLPGGLVLAGLLLPLVCRSQALPTLAFADAAAPTMCIAIVLIRLGCWLNGCCFGAVAHLPWAVRYAPGSQAYASQLAAGQLSAGAPFSLPVHPLPLYFLGAALLMLPVVLVLRRRQPFAGAATLALTFMYALSTVGLEALRPVPRVVNQLVGVAVALACGPLLLALRRGAPLRAYRPRVGEPRAEEA